MLAMHEISENVISEIEITNVPFRDVVIEPTWFLKEFRDKRAEIYVRGRPVVNFTTERMDKTKCLTFFKAIF